jgi:hypothetical protein
MKNEKENEEQPMLHANIAIVLPGMLALYQKGNGGHLKNVDDADNNGFKAIYYEHHSGIPSLEPYTV